MSERVSMVLRQMKGEHIREFIGNSFPIIFFTQLFFLLRLGETCIVLQHSRDLVGKGLAFGTFHLEPLDKSHNLQHMARELPNRRVKTISQRSIMGAWAGLSVLVSIRNQHGKRCPVFMREGTVATRVTVIMVGMIDYAWVLKNSCYAMVCTGLHYDSRRFY